MTLSLVGPGVPGQWPVPATHTYPPFFGKPKDQQSGITPLPRAPIFCLHPDRDSEMQGPIDNHGPSHALGSTVVALPEPVLTSASNSIVKVSLYHPLGDMTLTGIQRGRNQDDDGNEEKIEATKVFSAKYRTMPLPEEISACYIR